MSNSNLFYLKLKEHRESNNISLEEISDFTKIDIKYLTAIEEGDFGCLPNVYIRLFLRSYCKYIKSDHSKALNEYELLTMGEIASDPSHHTTNANVLNAESTEPENILTDNDFELPPVTRSQVITILITISILGFIFYLISTISSQGAPEEAVIEMELTKEETITAEYSSIPDEELLTNKEYENNLITSNSSILDTEFAPYIFTINPLTKTKIHIDNNGKIINKIINPGDYLSLEIDSVIKFDLWSAAHVECKLNDIIISDFFGKEDVSIRGSFETRNQKLYYQIHSHI